MSNRPVTDLLAGWLEDTGFTVDVMQVSDHPAKVNLIAMAGKGPGGLVLSGHTDTVPYDETGWRQDPFTLTEYDNRYHGLGVADMKCFFPIVLDVIRDIDLKRLKHPLYVLATSDEESTMSGAKALVAAHRTLGRYALIGEPTGLKPVNAHKGVLFESIRLVGHSGHSSDPSLGKNALEGMNAVINRLTAWRLDLQRRETNPAFAIPVPTLNFGSIQGGDSPNRICGECEMKIDLRFLPHMDMEEQRAAIRRSVMEAVDGAGLIVEFDPMFSGLPGMETSRASNIVKQAVQLTGVEPGTVAFGTEGPYLNALGMDTIILGAGDIDAAHRANEYLPLARIAPMKQIVAGMIKHFCM
jgi:acetylornithine deacetylase